MLFRLSAFALALLAPAFAAADTAQIEKVLRRIESSRSLPENLRTLCEEIGPRMAGTAGMRRAAAWARRAFREAGVDSAAIEPAPMPLRWREGATAVSVLGGQGFPIRAASSALSPAAPRGGIEAQAAYAGTGSPGHILSRRGELEGKLLLIRLREVRSFEGLAVEQRGAMVAMREAAQVGTAGVLFIATRPNGLMYRHINGIRGKLDPLPSAVLAREDGLRLLRAMEENPGLRMRLDLPNKIGGGYDTRNVIAEIRGGELPHEIVLLGAHLDSWDMGSGCLDNASNAALVVEVARAAAAAGVRPRRTLRFALFGGEEFGLFGSRAYIRRRRGELDNHAAVIVHDMGAGPVKGYSAGGRRSLLQNLQAVLEPLAERGRPEPMAEAFFGSDHFDFLLQGVPSLIAVQDTSEYYASYHSEADTFDKIDMRQVRAGAVAAAAVALGIADMNGRFGERLGRAGVEKLLRETGLDEQMRFLGIWDDWKTGDRAYIEPQAAPAGR